MKSLLALLAAAALTSCAPGSKSSSAAAASTPSRAPLAPSPGLFVGSPRTSPAQADTLAMALPPQP